MNGPFQELSLRFKRHEITVTRSRPGQQWYIRVVAPNGCYAYDGWWRDSSDRTSAEAVEEAKRGALLEEPQ